MTGRILVTYLFELFGIGCAIYLQLVVYRELIPTTNSPLTIGFGIFLSIVALIAITSNHQFFENERIQREPH